MYSYFLILTILFNAPLTRGKQGAVQNVTIPCDDDELCKSELPGSKCVKRIRKLGMECRSAKDCLIEYSECVIKEGQRLCDCIEEAVASEDGKTCLPLIPELFYPCSENVQCSSIPNTECVGKVCRCKEGTTPHLEACYPNRALGDACQESEDCIAVQNSECYANQCVCKKGYIIGKATCLLAVEGLREPCLEDVQCTWNLGDGAECFHNQCFCRRRYNLKQETRRCARHINLLRNCTKDVDCYNTVGDDEYIECSNATCNCKPPYKEFEDDCVIAAASTVNDLETEGDFNPDMVMARLMSHRSCRLDRDCEPNSFCIGNDATTPGFCRCEDGWIISRNRTFYECVRPAEGIGSNCTRDLECTYTLGNPSSCIAGTCQCNEGAHWASNNQCYTTSRPGDICNVDFNCLLSDGTIGSCHIGRCRCPIRHHHTADGRCVPTSRLGENCTTDDNCRHTFANCIGVCRCLPGYVISENGWRCLEAATEFDQRCDELAQCSTYLSGSFCRNNSCVCHPGFHALGPRCWQSAVAGARCEDRRNCFISPDLVDGRSVDCLDGLCTCNEGFESVRGDCLERSRSTNTMYSMYVIAINIFLIFAWTR
ncbi:hypothetical protein Trydic_g6663 [Trypoxylus dichotomus]